MRTTSPARPRTFSICLLIPGLFPNRSSSWTSVIQPGVSAAVILHMGLGRTVLFCFSFLSLPTFPLYIVLGSHITHWTFLATTDPATIATNRVQNFCICSNRNSAPSRQYPCLTMQPLHGGTAPPSVWRAPRQEPHRGENTVHLSSRVWLISHSASFSILQIHPCRSSARVSLHF